MTKNKTDINKAKLKKKKKKRKCFFLNKYIKMAKEQSY